MFQYYNWRFVAYRMSQQMCIINVSESDISVCYKEGNDLFRIKMSQTEYLMKGTVSFGMNKSIFLNTLLSQDILGTVKDFFRYPARTYREIYDNANMEEDFIGVRLLDYKDGPYLVIDEKYSMSIKSVFEYIFSEVVKIIISYHRTFDKFVVCVPRYYGEAEFNIIKQCFRENQIVPYIIHDYTAVVASLIQDESILGQDGYYAVIHSKYFSTDYLIIQVQYQNGTPVLTVLKHRELMNISIAALKNHVRELFRKRWITSMSETKLPDDIFISLEDDFWTKKEDVRYVHEIIGHESTKEYRLKLDYWEVEMFLRQCGYASLFLTNRMLDTCGVDFNNATILVAGLLLQSDSFLVDRNVFALENQIKLLDIPNYLFWGSVHALTLNIDEQTNKTSLPVSVWFYSSANSIKLLLDKGTLLPNSSGFAFIPKLKSGVEPAQTEKTSQPLGTMTFALVSSEQSGDEGRRVVEDGEGRLILNGDMEYSPDEKEKSNNVFYLHLTVTKNFVVDFTVTHLAKNSVVFQQRAPLSSFSFSVCSTNTQDFSHHQILLHHVLARLRNLERARLLLHQAVSAPHAPSPRLPSQRVLILHARILLVHRLRLPSRVLHAAIADRQLHSSTRLDHQRALQHEVLDLQILRVDRQHRLLPDLHVRSEMARDVRRRQSRPRRQRHQREARHAHRLREREIVLLAAHFHALRAQHAPVELVDVLLAGEEGFGVARRLELRHGVLVAVLHRGEAQPARQRDESHGRGVPHEQLRVVLHHALQADRRFERGARGVFVLGVDELLHDAAALAQNRAVIIEPHAEKVDVSGVAARQPALSLALAVALRVGHVALPRARLQHVLQLVVLHVARQALSALPHQLADSAHFLARTAHDRHAAERVAELLHHAEQRREAVHRKAVGVLEKHHVADVLGRPGLRNAVLAHQEMNIAVAVRFEEDVAVFAHGDLALRVADRRNAVLLHDRHVFRLQVEVLVRLEQLDGARNQQREEEEKTRRWCRRTS